MITAHFEQHSEHLKHYLSQAKSRILIAVCWFSNKEIFEVLLTKLKAGVEIELILEFDNRNICEDGLDFQVFIQLGGNLLASKEPGLMHHKFAIIDHELLISGSFNWTYNTNAENLIITSNKGILLAFLTEFTRIKGVSKAISYVRPEEAKIFGMQLLFEKAQFSLTDLRKMISKGTSVWLVNIPKNRFVDIEFVLSHNLMPFDKPYLLADYWSTSTTWNLSSLKIILETLFATFSRQKLRNLICWVQRIQVGDIIFLIGKSDKAADQALWGIGIIQSMPQPFSSSGFSSFRSVHWIKILKNNPYYFNDKLPHSLPAKYRGSALRVVQETMS